MDERSLQLLELDRVTAAVAERAAGDGARARLAAARPIGDAAARATEVAQLAEAMRRQSEPGDWCATGPGGLQPWLERAVTQGLEGTALLDVRGWLDAARATRAAWDDDETAARLPGLAAGARALPIPASLHARLETALEPDGRLADAASPALARARRALEHGERDVQGQLERWARAFGEESYVTRHGDRFVALVPAAGFPRRRAIVHDISGTGQSLFVEPIEACEANNQLTELRAVAAEEERRILRELTEAVRAEAPALAVLEDTLVHFDGLRARARWAREVGAVALLPAGERLELKNARHPLLAMGERRGDLVPLDLELEAPGRLLLVSGPNMGGKTVLLKTAGLAVALAHAAFPVPAAEGSVVPEIDAIVVDLGDEQSVDRGLSTFAAHLMRLVEMARVAGPRSLLLCDELGAGTDPEEGGAIARALLEHFAARGAWGVITTHLGSLKRAAGEIAGVVNGSLEFDARTMRPLFRFIPGVPGASHALAVAGRMGFPPSVLERARVLTPEAAETLERLLGEVQEARRRLEAEHQACEAARRDAEGAAAASRSAAEDARRTLASLRARLTHESESVLARVRELWQTVQREARRAEKSRAGAERLGGEIAAIEESLEALRRQTGETREASGPPAAVAAGDRVRVRDLGVEAEVVSGPDGEGRVVVRRGSWNIHSHVSRLEPLAAAAPGDDRRPVRATWESPEEAPSLEVDLRGMESDEALRAVDGALDRAVVGGFTEIRIIHGIGRGVLRAAVERHLRGHPQVSAQRLGAVGEGGRGVTVASLR